MRFIIGWKSFSLRIRLGKVRLGFVLFRKINSRFVRRHYIGDRDCILRKKM